MPGLPSLRDHLLFLYGEDRPKGAAARLDRLIAEHTGFAQAPPIGDPLSEKDLLLISYPDQVQRPGYPPLRVLNGFLGRHAGDLVSAVHLLPFFPSSSDDGFSVMDYRSVNPVYGSWGDV